MIQYALEQLFDYLFQYLVGNLVKDAFSDARQSSTIDETPPPGNSGPEAESTTVQDVLSQSLEKRSTGSSECHIQVCYMDPTQKKMVNYNMTVRRSMKVADVKKELYDQLNDNVESWSDLAILFMGKELANHLEISGCDLGDYSTLHALDSAKVKRNKSAIAGDDVPLSQLPVKLTTIEEPDNNISAQETVASTSTANQTAIESTQGKLYFFVFCQSCAALRPGKLRVFCEQCENGSILFKREPQDWDDVLIAGRIECKCYTPGCTGTRARFFFKCIDEAQHAVQLSSASRVTPLNRLRRNNIHISCLACMDGQVEVVLVFPCDHVICLECFRDYSKTALSERSLIWSESLGFSVNCPIDCDSSAIEPAYLNLLDDHYYSLYTRFSSEELVLKNGGMLCPYSDCDQAFYPASVPPTSCEVTECQKCRMLYCILCTYEGQYAAVTCPFETLIEQTNAEIRKGAKLKQVTPTRSTYLSSLVEKFSLLRRMASSVTGAGERQEAPRWQDTMSRMKIREIAKPCPKCRTPTERNGGCMHMVCTRKRCNFNWCWLCLSEWNSECMSTHWFG